MGADIKKHDRIFKFYINNSYISRDGESPLASEFASQRVIVQRRAKPPSHKQHKSLLKLANKLRMRTDSLLELLFERSITLDRLHG